MEAKISAANISRLKDKAELLSAIDKEITTSETTLNQWKNDLLRYNELYCMVQRKKHYQGLADIFVPELLRAVETIVGKLYGVIAGQPDWFEYQGREAEDEKSAIAETQLVHYQMDTNSFKSRLMDSLRQMVILGLTVRKILWDFEEVTTKRTAYEPTERLNPLTNKLEKVDKFGVQEKVETIKDTWTFEPVDLLSFHISDITTPYNDIQRATWIAEQYIVEKDWIKRKIKKGWFDGSMLPLLNSDSPDAKVSQASTLRDNRAMSSGFSFTALSKKGKVEIIERWGLLGASLVYTKEEMKTKQLDDDDLVETVCIIANRTVILKLEDNPFWHGRKPYVACPYVPKENEFAGIGASQIGGKLQEELNDTRNQTMDNKTLILMCMWLKHRGAGINNKDLQIRPMGVIPTNDMTGLTPLRPPVLTGVGVNIESVVKDDLREAVGANSNLQGIAQAGIGSATEASQINKDSIGRLLLTAELYGELILKRTLEMVEYLNYQFYDHNKVIKIVGPIGVSFRQLAPQELVGQKDVTINISTDFSESPAVRRQQIMNFFTILQPMPPEVMQFHYKLLDKIYQMFFPGRKLDELYPAPPNAEEALTPEEEVDLVLAEHKAEAVPGQDHKSCLEYEIAEFDRMKYALNPKQFDLFKHLIISHQVALEAELQQQQAQAMMQQQALAQQGPQGTPGGGKKANVSMNTMSRGPISDGGMTQQPGV